MKAVVYERYGPPEVLHIQEVPKPVPADDEILVKVHATTVHTGDTILRSLNVPGPFWQQILARLFMGLGKPRNPILGMELAGEVEAVGPLVDKYHPGDHVFASTLWSNLGAYAEYKCLPQDLTVLAKKPANLSFEEAAAIPSGSLTALRVMQKADIQTGDQVMVYGASGNAGSFALQIAKHYGAEVTGVCSTDKMDMVNSLGADHVLDYTKEDFTRLANRYDVVFDAVGKLPKSKGRMLLKESGVYLSIGKDSGGMSDKFDAAEMLLLKNLAENGELKAHIDRSFPLDQIVEAHRYVDQGHKKGNVVIRVAPTPG